MNMLEFLGCETLRAASMNRVFTHIFTDSLTDKLFCFGDHCPTLNFFNLMELIRNLMGQVGNLMGHVGNLMGQVGNPLGQAGNPISQDLNWDINFKLQTVTYKSKQFFCVTL